MWRGQRVTCQTGRQKRKDRKAAIHHALKENKGQNHHECHKGADRKSTGPFEGTMSLELPRVPCARIRADFTKCWMTKLGKQEPPGSKDKSCPEAEPVNPSCRNMPSSQACYHRHVVEGTLAMNPKRQQVHNGNHVVKLLAFQAQPNEVRPEGIRCGCHA